MPQCARILFVDDDPAVLDSLRRGLCRCFDMVTALGPKEGLAALAERGPFAVVVSDLRMPGMDGVTLLKKAKELCPNIVPVMLTGHADLTAAMAAVNEGHIFRFLTKPCPIPTLSLALDAALEQYRLTASEKELVRITLENARLKEDVERIMRHDLKAPLNSIVNLPGLVMAVGEVNEEQQEMLAEIERAGHVMLEQIELSLDLYRMETATYVLTAQRVDMARIVSGVAEMLAKTARARGVAVSVEAEGPVFALGDALLCQTIAANLLKNAIEAEPPGSAVTVRVAGQGERVVFTVANPAMVPEDIAPVFFEKYTTGGKKGGSGLGAYSARLMTLCQHGAIRMETSPETGTLVEVSLPMG